MTKACFYGLNFLAYELKNLSSEKR